MSKKSYIYFYFLVIVPCLILAFIGIAIEMIGAFIEMIGNTIQKPSWKLKKYLEGK